MKKLFFSAAFLLSACQMSNVSYETAILADAVNVTNTAVETTGPTMELSAYDCKRVIEGEAPSGSIALDRLKAKAAQNGFNSLHSVTVSSTGAAALMSNCWSQVQASGIAYNQ
ncbi:hypothetical protein [Celeribacter halophilus]|uniref:hypothetical protein n=1 Tax=Celeribacter halophilus TaxID=576117 RepID=UPI003A8E3EE9